MKYSISVLTVEGNQEKIKQMDNLQSDYIHLDVMDGLFVDNKVSFDTIKNIHTPLDIHFMVKDVQAYIDAYKHLLPVYMTFHIEAVENPKEMIQYIKEKGIKVGISLNPETEIDTLYPYLQDIDLVLVMTVHPGYGGQTFIEKTTNKIDSLHEIKEKENLSYIIEVDGGINLENSIKCKKADILVVGSYITDAIDPCQRLTNIKQKFM